MPVCLKQREMQAERERMVEETLLQRIHPGTSLAIEPIVHLLPEFTWQEIFFAIGRLREQGTITVHPSPDRRQPKNLQIYIHHHAKGKGERNLTQS